MAMQRRLAALVERRVLVIEEVEGAGSQGRPAKCCRQGTLPSADLWTMQQGLETTRNAFQ